MPLTRPPAHIAPPFLLCSFCLCCLSQHEDFSHLECVPVNQQFRPSLMMSSTLDTSRDPGRDLRLTPTLGRVNVLGRRQEMGLDTQGGG